TVGDPAVLERLDAEVAELDGRLRPGRAGATPAELLAVLGLAGEQHQASPPSGVSGALTSVSVVSGSTVGSSIGAAPSFSGRGRPRPGPPPRPPGRPGPPPGRRRRWTSPSPSRS